tara:strand:- start:1103 stop:1294 length:192 start_codon:yes stop_codon:yes gene_type:complete
MKFIVVGYMLVAVFIEPDGVVSGKALDYYTNFQDCNKAATEHKMFSDPGIGFICLEDAVKAND